MESTVPSPAVELPRPGDVVCHKYRIEALLGQGGMGIVMRAVDTSLGRPVAIKFLAPHKASTEGAVARFLREARAAAAIQSEHVVRVFEVDTLVAGTPFIVMEHLTGSDLAQLLAARGRFPIDRACDYILQACQALGEAHRLGIVHRDLKPSNLFLTQRPDGTPCIKVFDFGISKAADDGSATSLTSTGMVMGTPQYMSPEQVRSLRDVDARADIWALGAILFELLTDSAIFEAPTASALCAMIAMDPPVPLRVRFPSAPPELEAAILRCLHKDPVGRFQDVAALADALAPFASARGRMSVEVVSKVVRGSSNPSAFAVAPTATAPPAPPPMTSPASLAPTLGPDSLPGWLPGAGRGGSVPAGRGPSAAPPSDPAAPFLYPTTESAWQQMGRPSRGGGATSGAAGAVLGAAAVLVVGVAAVGGYLFVKRRGTVAVVAPNVADAGQAAAPHPSPLPSTLVAGPSDSAPVSPPVSPPMSPETAALAKEAEQSCRLHTTSMSLAASPTAHKRAATEAKVAMCRGNASSRCERDVCLSACTYLHDQPCIRQITSVIDHGPAAKY